MALENLESVEQKRKNNDLSDYPTEKLLGMILGNRTPTEATKLASEELAKRPEELREELEKIMSFPRQNMEILYQIPFIAEKVGREYQIEMAKRCLFRPEMIEVDMILRIGEEVNGMGLYSLIAKSQNDETAVLDRLISDGRLEKGSAFELEWRKKFSRNGAGSHQAGEERPDKAKSRSNVFAPEPGGTSDEPTETGSFGWLLVIGGILSAAILAVLIRARLRSRLS